MDVVRAVLPHGICVFCVDFSGSGWSEGEFVSLGYNEEIDLACVIDHLRSSGGTSAIGLWGRSMGAATAVLRAAKDRKIVALVLDSPYSDLRELAKETLGGFQPFVPDSLLDLGIERIRQEILTRAGFDIEKLSPVQRAEFITTPVLIARSLQDEVVNPQHAERLFHAWGCDDRQLLSFHGGHNDVRPKWFLDQGTQFLKECFQQNEMRKANHITRAETPPPAWIPSLGKGPHEPAEEKSYEERRHVAWVVGGQCQLPRPFEPLPRPPSCDLAIVVPPTLLQSRSILPPGDVSPLPLDFRMVANASDIPHRAAESNDALAACLASPFVLSEEERYLKWMTEGRTQVSVMPASRRLAQMVDFSFL
jgi:hypothetical protein